MASSQIGYGISIGDFSEFHINPQELNDLVEMHGVGAELRQSVLCPCQRVETGMARGVCPHCKGLTWTYPEAQREPVMVLLSGRKPTIKNEASGWVREGSQSATWPLGYHPKRGDIVLPDCEEHIVDQIIHRASHQVSSKTLRDRETSFGMQSIPAKSQVDRILYDDARIESVYWISPYSGGPKEKLVEAKEGRDFRMSGDRIIWLGDTGPRPGDGYSVRYSAPAAYVVLLTEPVFRSEGGVPFPYRSDVERLDSYALKDLLGSVKNVVRPGDVGV